MAQQREENFQITLPSTSSATLFPTNRSQKYRTQLIKRLHLGGSGFGLDEWEVALVDIQFPQNWPNVLEHTAIGFIVCYDQKAHGQSPIVCDIPPFMMNVLRKAVPPDGASAATTTVGLTATATKKSDFETEMFKFYMTTDKIADILQYRKVTNPAHVPLVGDEYPWRLYTYMDCCLIPKGHFASVRELGNYIRTRFLELMTPVNARLRAKRAAEVDLTFHFDPFTSTAHFQPSGPVKIYFVSNDAYVLKTLFGFQPSYETPATPTTASSLGIKLIQQYQFPTGGQHVADEDDEDAPPQIRRSSVLDQFKDELPCKFALYELPLESTRPCSLEHLNCMYVYSDIAKSQLVGDTEGQLLGIVPIQAEAEDVPRPGGSTVYYSFNPPYYIPLAKNEFETIDIELKTDWGADFPFAADANNRICCRLDFRKRGTGSGASSLSRYLL